MKNKTRYAVAAMCIIVIAGVFVIAFSGGNGQLKVVFPPLGKADCAVLYEEGVCVVIDCGNKGDGKGIADLCASLGAEKIDCLFITHFDKDHIGGASKLLTAMKVETVYEPDYDDSAVDINEYSAYRLALETACAGGTKLVKLRADVTFTLGEMTFSVWPPHVAYDKSTDNNSSLVIMVASHGKKLLFTGDIEKQRIDDMLPSYALGCDFLKVPHHGVYSKSAVSLIKACSPSAAVITCEDRSSLESALTLALQGLGTDVRFTDSGKTVVLTCSKNSLHFSEE